MSDCVMYLDLIQSHLDAINGMSDGTGTPTDEQKEQLNHLKYFDDEYDRYNRECGSIVISEDGAVYTMEVTTDPGMPGWAGDPPDVDMSAYAYEYTDPSTGEKTTRYGVDTESKEYKFKIDVSDPSPATAEAPVGEFCEGIMPPPIDAIIDLNSGLTPCDNSLSVGEDSYIIHENSQGPQTTGTPRGYKYHENNSMKLNSVAATAYLERILDREDIKEEELRAFWYKYVLERIPADQPPAVDDSFLIEVGKTEDSPDSIASSTDNFGLLMSGRKVEFSNVYNYYAGNYEEYFKSRDISEKLLPSIYSAFLNNSDPSDDMLFTIDPFVAGSLDFFGKNSFLGEIDHTTTTTTVNIQEHTSFRQRFEEYVRDIRTLNVDDKNNIESKSSNIIFTPDSYTAFEELSSTISTDSSATSTFQFQRYTDIFPMYNAISFSPDPQKWTEYESDHVGGISHASGSLRLGWGMSSTDRAQNLLSALTTYIKQAVSVFETSAADYSTATIQKIAGGQTLTDLESTESSPMLELLVKHGIEVKNIKVNESNQLIKSFSISNILQRFRDISALMDDIGVDSLDGDINAENKHILVDNSDQLFLGDFSGTLADDPSDPYNTFIIQTKADDFISAIEDFSENNIPTFAEFCNHKNRSETVLYRIAKFRGSVGKEPINTAYGTPFQNIWFPQPDDDSPPEITFIDTQIKYGETYTYVLYAYELVFGTEAEYTYNTGDGNMKELYSAFGLDIPSSLAGDIGNSTLPVWQKDDDDDDAYSAYATFMTKIRPHYRINEVEVFKKTTTMVDKPPMQPDVSILPVGKTESKLLFSFNTAFGEQKLNPIYIDESAESPRMDEVKAAYSPGPGTAIPFKSDDLTSQFEIYRLDSPPNSYSDFKNNLRDSVLAGDNTFASYVETLKPNKKYYYTFRSVDLHGNTSNPTPIYEIRMIKDSSGDSVVTFPEIKQYILESEKPQLTKKFKKLFNLVPQPDQAAISEGSGPAVNYESLPEVQLFGDTTAESLFKIRITSPKTGKKVDLNISFVKQENPS